MYDKAIFKRGQVSHMLCVGSAVMMYENTTTIYLRGIIAKISCGAIYVRGHVRQNVW